MNIDHEIHILLIEDSATDALLIDRVLEDVVEFKYHVARTESMAEGVARARTANFDLVILDLGLPDAKGGLDTFRKFQQMVPDMPVLVLTGLDDNSVGLQSIQHGAQDYLLKKDIRASELSRAIRYAIERHRVAVELRASEERFQLAVRGATAGLWDWNPQTGAMYFSPHFKAIMGNAQNNLPNEASVHQEAIHPEDIDRVTACLTAHLEHKNAYDVEYRIRTMSGEYRWVQSRGQALWNISGQPYRMVGWIIDVTERKLAEEAQRDSRERAAEALQQTQADMARLNRVLMLGEMAASIAHEVKQPVSAVVMHATAGLRWLDAQPPELEEARQSLSHILKQGNRVVEVVGHVRSLVKQVPPREDPVDINEAIVEVLALINAELQRNSVRLQTCLSANLPPVLGDRVKMQQVIVNLVMNASEAMSAVSDRQRELTIVSERSDSNAVIVEVWDTGSGLPPGSTEQLFRSFYTTKPSGMGMGLSISRSIVEAHGGRLWVTPREPNGTVFRFTLPIEANIAQ
ncbi:ATP-binding protein [Paraburkholderia sp. BR10954]|uniref:ATP-binding protein n=1 Tax=Paraburkholderia sp. BR10954 TaxID=3236995 RepID=UPI0034D1F254